jgi:hypothetical protein
MQRMNSMEYIACNACIKGDKMHRWHGRILKLEAGRLPHGPQAPAPAVVAAALAHVRIIAEEYEGDAGLDAMIEGVSGRFQTGSLAERLGRAMGLSQEALKTLLVERSRESRDAERGRMPWTQASR